ncbi:MAG: hypothetical protein V2J24_21545 [Pseudomonadales bacterium]|jgi:hypothetical protein|nr:hypothetical protein [Pseudomonadales bacterium]
MSTQTMDLAGPEAFGAPSVDSAGGNRFAALLRWLGAATVASSAAVFLLQGLGDVEGMLRNWGVLALMALLAVAGVATRAVTEDARSVRLLLGIATALLPVQASQLGGMLHALLTREPTLLSDFFAYEAVTWSGFAAVAGSTLLAWLLVARLGFSVLVRRDARMLTALSLLPSALLLGPIRAGLPGFGLLALLAVLVLVVDRALQVRSAHYRTPEGLAVRAMLGLPLLIAAGRYAFHVDPLAGACALAGLGGAALTWTGQHCAQRGLLAEALTFTGSMLALLAWLVWCVEGIADAASLWVTLPSAALLFFVGRDAALGPLYRGLACALLAVAGLELLEAGGLAPAFQALGLGLGTAAWGVQGRQRGAAVTGVLLTLAAAVALVAEVVGVFEFASWIVLALGGVALVVLAAFVERYGRTLPGRLRSGWAALGAPR